MSVSSLKTEILDYANKNKVIYYGELASTVIRKYIGKNAVVIDAREIQDCKLLAGTHAFETTGLYYKHGILLDAMLKGKTLAILNIDKNTRLYNYLQSLIEENVIYADGTIETAQSGFRIFYTSTEYIENKNMITYGPIDFTLAEAFDFISETIDVKRDIRNKVAYIFEHIYDMQLTSQIDISTFYKLEILLKMNNLTTEALYDNFVKLFMAGYEENGRNEMTRNLRELLCMGEVQTIIEEKYIFDNFNVNPKNIGTIKTIVTHIANNNPIVITGETGVGKTTLIQKISENAFPLFGYHTNLVVYNMSYDVDLQELVGLYEGYPNHKIKAYRKKYKIENKNDTEFLHELCLTLQKLDDRTSKEELREVKYLITNISRRFVYKENVLLQAIKNGNWLLLDEINLAPDEVLDALNAIIEQKRIYVSERGDIVPVQFHRNFRIFGCMNPGTDYGKKYFKSNVFCEVFYDDFSSDYEQLLQIANRKLVQTENVNSEMLQKNAALIVKSKNVQNELVMLGNLSEALSLFFIDVKKGMAEHTLRGNEIEPVITGRTFTRLLSNVKMCNLHDIIDILFYTQFCVESHAELDKIIAKYINDRPAKKIMTSKYIDTEFYITKRNKRHIYMIENCIRLGLPIILQGPTSTGKTSSLYHLAKKHNVKLHRINNHENTEVSDYLGNYKCDKNGNMYFEKGILIRAMLNGDWLLLDELNLAQSEVLEVLNRLLDDNNEIMCNNEIVRPHRKFRLFATQNLNYSGRKKLSKAFRNRFIEIFYDKFYIDDIKELLVCKGLPKSYIDLISQIYDKLSSLRSYNHLITTRDIFKWIDGNIETRKDLFIAGLNATCEKQRSNIVKENILDIFECVFKIDRASYFDRMHSLEIIKSYSQNCFYASNYIIIDDFVFTKSYIKLFNLLHENYMKKNPVLVVGETGIGKTKCIEVLSKMCNRPLYTIGMHENIDSSDFVGNFTVPVTWNDGPLLKAMKEGGLLLIDEINLGQCSVLEQLNSVFETNKSIYISDINLTRSAVGDFNIFACMNPGTDFGKKELSPALRNRFTEIYFDISNEEKYDIFEVMLRRNIHDKDFCDRFIYLLQQNMHLISDLSLRKTMDVIASIKSYYKKQNVIVVKNADISADFVFGEIFASNHLESTDWDCYTENNTDYIGVHPYYIENMSSNTLPILSKMTKRNMSMLFKALLGDKPILLKGSPGVGKTSFVMQLANYLKYNCIRINLSDETEFYELCGSYMPRVENNNLTIDFVNSELVEGIQSDSWIILDEINLATQTVIEGLNSLLDHRKELYLNKTIKMTQNTRIFATMNDFCTLDGRKTLPKSFLDRFIILEMNDYNEEDIIFITNKYIRNMDTDKGTYSDTKHALVKEVNGTKIYKNLELANCTKLEKLCLDRIKIGCTLRNMFSYLKLMISDSDKVRYKYENSNFTIETASILFESRCNLDNSYTITHTNINKLLQILLCIVNNIPVIITGSIGKSMVADFVSKVLGMKKYTLYCHGEIDCNDLLGQFTYTDGRFSWQNSLLIENCMENNTLIVFDKPEHIQKAVFDRLNALFEGQKVINIHEKGIDTKTTIGQALGIVLLCNDTTGLSNAILDRCWKVQLDSNLDEIDINKICNTPCIEREEPHKKVKENDFEKDNNLCLDNITLLKNKYTPSMVTNLQNVDYNCLTFIRNTLDEAEIRDLLQLNTLHFDYSIEEMQVKGRSDYKQLLGFYKKINYNIKTHDSDFDKLKAMGRYKTIEKQIISFVKNSNLSILPEKPKNLDQLKLDIFQYITSTTIKEYKKCRRYAKLCKDLHFVCDHFAFDDYYFEFASVIFGHKCKPFDPLLLLKIEIIDRYNAKIEEVKKTIVDQFVKLYKYGRSKIEEAFDKFTKITSKTETKLRKIDNLLQRNFACHIEEFKSLNLQERISQLAATNTFSDICDYSLLRQYNTTSAIKPNTLQSLYLSQNALEIGERKKLFEVIKKYNVALNNDFCKNFFVETDTSCEMLLAENITYEIESTDNEWFNNPLNDYQNIFDKVFENLFSDRDRYTINFYPENKITITNKFYAVLKLLKTTNEDIYRKISNLSIMTTPEHIIEHYNTPEILKYYQSCNKSFDWVHNYSWLVMLHLIEFTHDRIAEYLLNTKIYQFFERQSFIKEYLQNHDPSTDTSLLYNLSLQYESFEINKKYENHKNSNIKKVWYDSTEFRKYKKILQEDTLSHITAVTINQEDYCCECETCKFDSTDSYRNNILQTLRKNDDKTCKFDIVENEELHAVCYKTFDIPNIFYNRSVAQRYTNFEIQIAKIFNEYMQIIDSLEKKQRFIVDSLFYIAVEEQICINILLLIHQILEKSKKYETENGGDGMKEGTGEKNVSEDIKQEEEICDDIKFEEIEDIAESDAVENSNEGCIDDVSNESEYSSQETIGCEEQETENDNENENSSEEIKNCDSDNNDFDDQTLSDENMDCEDEETNMNENEEQEENDENEANNYQAISGDLNDEQTCENADNYESRVNGLKLENEGAIEEQGDERVEDNKFANEDTENEKMTKIHSANEDLSLKDTNDSSTKLVNILKYVFYGNRKNKYNGDYRSGKKLNMKKIIPFVLSDYRKDKIWLKRNRKEKSDYIVRIFVDNSQSMNQKTILDRLGEIFANLAKAFEILEIPIEIYSFGSSLDSYRNREDFFRTVRFDHNSTNIDWIGKFRDGINIILTDGIFQVQCENNHNFILLLINSSKIHTMKKIIVTGDAIITKRYIDSIKIRYCIVDKIENLEEEFVSAMKELVNNNE